MRSLRRALTWFLAYSKVSLPTRGRYIAFTKVSRTRTGFPVRSTGSRAAEAPAPGRPGVTNPAAADCAGVPVPSLIGALLRVPAQAIQRRLIAGLNASGFPELR